MAARPTSGSGSLPFDHERQLVIRRRADPDGGDTLLVTKGAPEAVLARCVDVPPDGAARPRAAVRRRRTRRRRRHPRRSRALHQPSADDERDLSSSGSSPSAIRPKADAGASIAKLAALGIDVKIITGDNGTVAAKVCRDIGLDARRRC